MIIVWLLNLHIYEYTAYDHRKSQSYYQKGIVKFK